MKLRVCLYCRVGSAAQLDDWTMEAQHSRLKRYAEDRDLKIVGQICEYGVGTTMNRPGLQEVADDFFNLLQRHNVTLISIDKWLKLPPQRKQNTASFTSL